MSSVSTASSSATSSATTTTKKVEWYHLDRVAIAKRICLDPATVKLKTALNNNNNNNNNYNNLNNNNGATNGINGSSGVKKASGAVNGNTTATTTTGNTGSSVSNSNSTIINPSVGPKKPSTAFDISRLLARPTSTTTNSSSTPTSGSADATIFSLRFGNPGGVGVVPVGGANAVVTSGVKQTFLSTSTAGSRQLQALQQKRRRKAARLAAVATNDDEAEEHLRSGAKKAKTQDSNSKDFLDVASILVNGTTGTGSEASSCGSSSRSSSGVSSDFEELDSTSTSTSTSSPKMKKVKGGGSGSGSQGGGGGSSGSSSECEDDDEEGFKSKKKNKNGNSSKMGNKGEGVVLCKPLVGVSGSSRVAQVVHRSGSGSSCGSGSDSGIGTNSKVNTKVSKVEGSSSSSSSSSSSTAPTTPVVVRSKHGQSTCTHSSASSTISGSTDNDRDTENSFSEFPNDLDFIGMSSDKGNKRRTDRYDSSESSDSGVATLSPSTSDSPELISTCCDFTSDSLDVGNLISASTSRSSSLSSTTSSYHHHHHHHHLHHHHHHHHNHHHSHLPSSVNSVSSSSPSLASSSSSSSSLGGIGIGRSTACFTENQGEPTGTTVSVSTTSIIEATLPSSSSSSSSSLTGSSDPNSLATNPPVQETLCQWKGCTCSTTEASYNILEHIQTSHVAPQMKTAGYVCLWEGCKVFNKRSSSLSWLERHVLSHSGNKPFKCIFPGCGLSFSSQTALERHVNSHIATNGTTNGTQGNSTVANKKLDASPAKSSRRKKIRFRKQRVNIGQRVDYFDKRIMEVIKHWLASSVDQFAVNAHDCTFRGEIMAKRVIANCERQVLVRWHPRFILPDEWMPESKYTEIKLVPLRRIPADKIRLLYPALFPPQRREKALRKRKQRTNNFLLRPLCTPPSTPTHSSEGSTIPPSLSPTTSRSTRTSSSASVSSSSSSSTSTSSSFSSSQNKSSNQKRTSASASLDRGPVKKQVKRGNNKCNKKFCASSVCNCISGLIGESDDDDDDDDDDSSKNNSEDDEDDHHHNPQDTSHWAVELLCEDLGIFPS